MSTRVFLNYYRVVLFLITINHFFFFAEKVNGQSATIKYNNGATRVKYNASNGMLDGKCIFYYKNGIKKAEGDFRCNNRIGKWDVYDSAGNLKVERIYTNQFDYRQIVPAIPDGPAKLLSTSLYIPTRNKDSCYKYYYIEERTIVWSKRIWSVAYNKDNLVFEYKNRLFNVLYKQATAKHITAYKFNNDDWDKTFVDSVNFDEAPLDTSKIRVIGFVMKVDWYYNIDMGIMDSRILGICPIALRKNSLLHDTVNKKYLHINEVGNSGDTLKLFWIFYPQVRKYLAKEPISDNSMPEYTQNLDDVLFWRCFGDLMIDEYSIHGIVPIKNVWGMRLKMLDWEHNIWTGKEDYN